MITVAVTIDEERDYQFLYTLKDALETLPNNSSFTVRGRSNPIEPLNHQEKYYFTWNKTNYLQELGLNLVVPKEFV